MVNTSLKEMSFSEKLKYLFSFLSVEPILAFYIIPNTLAATVIQKLFLEKACRVNLGYPVQVCDDISLHETGNQTQILEIQKLVSQMYTWQAVIKSGVPAFLLLFFGSFSDRTGRRKPFMLLPICGELLASIGLILCTIFYYQWPMEVAGIIDAVFPAITGSYFVLFMNAFSYLGDKTTVSERTVRLGILTVLVSVVGICATLSSGYLFEAVGFLGVLSIAAVMYFFAIVYGLIWLKEAKKPKKLEHSCIKSFVDPKNVLDTFHVAFKSREGNLRMRIFVILILAIAIPGVNQGEGAVGFYFTDYHFHWSLVEFTNYATYIQVLLFVGTSLGVGLFSQLLKMEDAMLGIVGCSSKLLASAVYAFAGNSLTFYIATLLEMFGGTNLIAMRSIASKLVPSDDLGKINSLIGLGDAVGPIMCKPLYSIVYNQTLQVLPGAFFLLSVSLMALAILLFGQLYYHQRKNPVANEEEQNPENNKESEHQKNNKENEDFNDPEISDIDTKL